MGDELKDLRNSVDKIKEGLKSIEECAKGIINCVKKNELIPDELTDSMSCFLDEHKSLKNSCTEIYSKIVEEPTELKSVNILEECIENLEKNSAKNLVSLFYKLHSDVSEVEELLQKEKDKLDIILSETKEIEKLEELVKDYIVFADTVNSFKDTTPSEVLSVMKELQGTFGDSLPMHAFVLNDIYIRQDDNGKDNRKNEKISEKTDTEGDSVKDSDSQDVVLDSDLTNETSKEYSSIFEEILIKNDAIIPEAYDFGLLNREISSKDDYKIGAKSFKSDLNEFYDKKIAIAIMVFVHELESTSYDLLNYLLANYDIDATLKQLINKGYLRKYSIVGKGEFYCESKRLLKACKIKDVCNLLKIKNKRVDDGEFLEDNPSIISSRLGYAKIKEKIKYVFDKKYNLESYNMRLSEATIEYVKSCDYGCGMFISINFTNTKEIDQFEQGIQFYINEFGKPNRIVVLSADNDYSKKYIKCISELVNLDDCEYYSYSYEDDCLYSYNTNEKVEFDSILWPLIEDDQIGSEEDVIGSEDDEDSIESVDDINEDLSNGEEIEIDSNLIDSKENLNTENSTIADTENNNVESIEVSIEVEKVDKEALLTTVYKMINDNKLYCALPYLYSFSKNNTEIYNIYRLFAYATNDPIKACRFSSTKMYDVYLKESSSVHDYLFASAALRTFFYNHVEYDYSMKQLYEGNILNLDIVNECLELKNIFRTLVLFKETVHKGINEYSDYRMQDIVDLEKHLEEIKGKAKQFYDDRILGRVKEKAKQERFVKTKKIVFDKEGDIAVYLQAIISEDKDYYPMMREFVCDNFMKESSEANIVNIDSIKMNKFMDDAWEKAGNTMRNIMKSSDLMSSLRRNLNKQITAAIDIMCEWLSYCGRFVNENDDGLSYYKKVRDTLLGDLNSAKSYFENLLSKNIEESSQAGCRILVLTLDELINRINGNYNEDEFKYFYIDFLKADVVLLNDNYLPVMDMNFKTPKGLGISDRIFDHSTMKLGSFEERLEEIFKFQGDDFGSAKLILSYLGDYGKELINQNSYDIEESINYGKKGAIKKKQEFLENLELMQSYGQIDITVENTKDKYLQIANNAFDFCYESNNFGFFRSVTDGFIRQIKEDAKQYENTIVSELNEYKSQIKNNENSSSILERLDDVQKMLDIQNYTVAQDLLSRIKKGDLDVSIEILPQDYLVKFIDQYDTNVARTADSSKSLLYLVSHKLRNPMNKDSKDGRKLIDNWPKPGSSLDAVRLNILLSTLGFNVDTVTKSDKVGKIDNYTVKLTKPKNGRKINYKHPIAAFGSNAINEDFRVAFIPGKTDADRLIMTMKELGNAKHTIFIVDYAIDLRDRRRLARKIKELYPTKVFGVIDRVMILFLAENYNDSYINQMLMSVMMPFSYVQPYVWDSGNVMPPEIFMGRDKELKDIESPTGVNIVYGGRQLGKSALLKMARNDINFDESGRRAVYVDIKGKDYRQSARKIGQALYDEGILDVDYDGYDWDELARLIKNRLNDDKRNIPYLLLLLDEADAFIESSEEENFSPLDALKDIQNVGAGRFKFVIAGLRNIVKFTKNALANNSVLTHLGSTTIVPFNYSEARELLEKPLYYLGLRFPKDKESLVSLIFANANYFPGLIQLYCAKLVEAMTKGDYAGYNQNEVPIYYVEQEHIKKVLSEEGFLQQVREKFEITLRLDEDNYYYIIALLMARLYHENGYLNGYTAYDIFTEGRYYGIKKIETAGYDKIGVFLDELCELNVLRRLSDDRFVFNRYNFFQMMGSRDEVDDKLMECMEEL